MTTEIIQVRDVPSEEVETLRARAAARNMSLSRYLRELIHAETTRPSMAEVLARIETRRPVEVGGDEIRALIDRDRA